MCILLFLSVYYVHFIYLDLESVKKEQKRYIYNITIYSTVLYYAILFYTIYYNTYI